MKAVNLALNKVEEILNEADPKPACLITVSTG